MLGAPEALQQVRPGGPGKGMVLRGARNVLDARQRVDAFVAVDLQRQRRRADGRRAELKLRGLREKLLLRRAFADVYPAYQLHQVGMGFEKTIDLSAAFGAYAAIAWFA